jgi:hypothetical protein
MEAESEGYALRLCGDAIGCPGLQAAPGYADRVDASCDGFRASLISQWSRSLKRPLDAQSLHGLGLTGALTKLSAFRRFPQNPINSFFLKKDV